MWNSSDVYTYTYTSAFVLDWCETVYTVVNIDQNLNIWSENPSDLIFDYVLKMMQVFGKFISFF